jgi:hypothetical protein
MPSLRRPSKSHMLGIRLARNNILKSQQDPRPVLKLGKGNVLTYAVVDQIYVLVSILIAMKYSTGYPDEQNGGISLTTALLREEEIRLLCSGEI